MCTIDEYYFSNQANAPTGQNNLPQNSRFGQRQTNSDRFEDNYDDVSGEEIVVERVKLGPTEAEHKSQKAKMILKLQRVLKGLAHTSIKLRESNPPDECADV